MNEICKSKLDCLLSGLPSNRFYFLLDPAGHYLELKAPDESRLWLTPQEHIGKHLSEVLPPELLADRLHHFDKALHTKKPEVWSYPHPLRKKPGWMKCEIEPILDEAGQVTEVFMQVYDIATPQDAPEGFRLDIAAVYPGKSEASSK